MFESNKEDSYTCPKCSLAPKIINLYRNIVQLECPIHGHISIELDSYMNESSKRIYLNKICGICNQSKQKDDQNIFKYCYDCDKVICYQCINEHQKNNENHINIISADLYTSKCYIHKGEDYQEFCYTCNKNICKLCYEEHQDHDKEKIEGLDEDIIEGDLALIEARKNFLEVLRNKKMQEVNEINNYIKFFDLIVNTKKKCGKNGYYIQNVETLRRDLDAQYEYKDKNKDIEELKNVFDGIKKLDQVKNKLLDEFNKKYSTNIKLDDEKIDLTGKNIKNEGLRQFCRINLENIKELIITKNDITSIKCLYEANLYNLEILKADQNRINSIEILPYLKCFKLKKLILNDNKLCNIETLGKLLEFNSLELIDLSNNYFDQKLESNQKIIHDLQQMIKIVKINEEENGTHENDITDEELNELMN